MPTPYEIAVVENARACRESAAHWVKLAEAQEDEAADLKARGLYADVHRSRAALYRRTAKALELEAETGLWHCVNHLKPLCVSPSPREGK